VLKRIIKILPFFLCVVFYTNITAQCVGSQSASMSPAGPYIAGQVVTVTYSLSSFTQININWIIAFDIDFGNGWSSISPISAPGNPGGSGGSWIWDNQNTYPSGLNYGPGYRFQNSSNFDWGTSSTGSFTFSFQLVVGNSCVPQDLSIDLSVIGDCQTGGWNNGSCCSVVPYSVYSGNSLFSNPSVVAGLNQTICNGGIPMPLTATSISIGTYSWTPPSAFTNPNLQNPSFNSGINTTTVYTVTFTDAYACITTDNVIITVNPVPSVTLSALPNPACFGDNIVLTAATSIPVSKYRFQYNTGSNWNNLTIPLWGVNNPVIYNNISQSTDFRVKVREANGCNASSWSQVITVPIVTFNTLPIWHN
jgi:hypothetical protein